MSEFSRYKLNNGLTLTNSAENFSSKNGNTVAIPVTIANQKNFICPNNITNKVKWYKYCRRVMK
jgi:hypothetical protein